MLNILWLLFAFNPTNDSWELNTDALPEPPQYVGSPRVGANGHLYFLDSSNHLIYHLDEKGRFIKSFGKSGEGPGELSYPYKMELLFENNQIFVADSAKEKMVVLDSNGKPLPPKIKVRNGSSPGMPFIIGKDQALFILSSIPMEKSHQNKGARIVKRFGDDRPEVLVTSFNGEQHQDWFRVQRGAVQLPWQRQTLLAVSPDGKTFYVGNNDRLKMQRYRSTDLKILGTVEDKTIPRPPLTDEEVEKERKNLSGFGKKITRAELNPPKSKPTVNRVLVDESGRLWAELVNRQGKKSKTYRVYHPDGVFAGQITLDEKIFHATQAHFWSTHENEDGDYIFAKRAYILTRDQ